MNFDFFGLKPGDLYNSQDEAACDAMSDIYEDSINKDIEYAGVVYQLNGDKYSYTKATERIEHASTPYKDNMSIYPSITATYHSHGDSHWWDSYDGENFSTPDINNVDKFGHDSYLITPEKAMKYYRHDKFRNSAPKVGRVNCGCKK